MHDWLVSGDDLHAFSAGLLEHRQYWSAFISLQAWQARGCDPATIPEIRTASTSSFWFRIATAGSFLLVAWHNYETIDRTIEFSVGLPDVSTQAAVTALEEQLPHQLHQVATTLHVRTVITAVDAELAPNLRWMRPDGTIPRLLSDLHGHSRDIAVCSTPASHLTGLSTAFGEGPHAVYSTLRR